jgi:hypothetical protein
VRLGGCARAAKIATFSEAAFHKQGALPATLDDLRTRPFFEQRAGVTSASLRISDLERLAPNRHLTMAATCAVPRPRSSSSSCALAKRFPPAP